MYPAVPIVPTPLFGDLCVLDGDAAAQTDDVPRFHYSVHHVTHQFGHRTPPDVKLRQVEKIIIIIIILAASTSSLQSRLKPWDL